jgi:hypothetical protein
LDAFAFAFAPNVAAAASDVSTSFAVQKRKASP